MTSLCIEYLKLPALCRPPVEDIDEYINQGCYGFMDYAISNWVRHFEAAVTRIGEDDSSSKKMFELSESLDVFFDLHWANPRKPAETADRHKGKLQLYEQSEIYDRLVVAFGWARKLVKSHTSISAAETVLDLVTVLVQVRQRIEAAWEASEHNIATRTSLRANYGADIYKCARPSCYHFNHGFGKKSLRDEHVEKHERSYRCNVEGCPSAVLGFTKQTDLQKHKDNTHDEFVVGEEAMNSFPRPGQKRKEVKALPVAKEAIAETSSKEPTQSSQSESDIQQAPRPDQIVDDGSNDDEGTSNSGPTLRRSPSPPSPEPMPPPERPAPLKKAKVYKCLACNKVFNKKSNYDSHMRIHSREKPFTCGYCFKGFARESDRKRHEAGHNTTGYICQACGKDFKRIDTLQNHFKSQAGSRCFESLQAAGA